MRRNTNRVTIPIIITCNVDASSEVKILYMRRIFRDYSKAGIHQPSAVTQVQKLEVERAWGGGGYTPQSGSGRTRLKRLAVDGRYLLATWNDGKNIDPTCDDTVTRSTCKALVLVIPIVLKSLFGKHNCYVKFLPRISLQEIHVNGYEPYLIFDNYIQTYSKLITRLITMLNALM